MMKKIIVLIMLSISPLGAMADDTDGNPILKYKMGDVISVHTDAEIAALCSFNTQIVITQNGALCVYNGRPYSQRSDD